MTNSVGFLRPNSIIVMAVRLTPAIEQILTKLDPTGSDTEYVTIGAGGEVT